MTDLRVTLPRRLSADAVAWIAGRLGSDAVTDVPDAGSDGAVLEAQHIEMIEPGQTVSVHVKHAAGTLDFTLLSPAEIVVVCATAKRTTE